MYIRLIRRTGSHEVLEFVNCRFLLQSKERVVRYSDINNILCLWCDRMGKHLQNFTTDTIK